MSKTAPSQLSTGAWLLSIIVTVTALVAWWTSYDGKISSAYQLFPLFGLVAFSLMWAHYVTAAVKMHTNADDAVLKKYFEVTSIVVLVALFLHPGLLAWQLWQDGLGLPPGSYFEFVTGTLQVSVIAGMVSWLTFMAYEFRRKFKDKKWWKYVQYASDAAMLLIFVHGLRLGSQLQGGWFQIVWYFYGLTLVASLVYMYSGKFVKPKKS